MKNLIIDTTGAAVEQQYRSFQLALTGMVADGMTGSAPTAPRARSAFMAAIHQIESSLLTVIAGLFDSALNDSIDAALLDAGSDADTAVRAAVLDDVLAARNAALGTVALALHKDCLTAAKRMRDFCLRVELIMASQGRSYAGAVISARIAEQAKPLSFSQLDSLGRKWKPSAFAGATVRAALQVAYADAFVRAAALEGDEVVEVRYPDPAHEGHGQRVSLASDALHPSYLSLRDTVFHPNSSATFARME